MNRKRQIIIAVLLMITVVGIMLAYVFHENQNKNSKVKQIEEEQEENTGQKDDVPEPHYYTYVGMARLYFLSEEEVENFKDTLIEWMSEEGLDIDIIKVKGKVEQKGNTWNFYLVLTGGRSRNVKVSYDPASKKYQYMIFEEEIPEENEGEIDENGNPVKEITDYDPGIADVDVGLVIISNPECLPENIDSTKLVEEMTEYLEKQNEFRRNITIDEDTIKGKEDFPITFTCNFDTPRIDQKNIQVSYDKDGLLFYD